MPSSDNKKGDYAFQEVVDTIENWLQNNYDPSAPKGPQAGDLAHALADTELIVTETAWGVLYPSGLFGEVKTLDAANRCVKSIEDDPYFVDIHPEAMIRYQTKWRKVKETDR